VTRIGLAATIVLFTDITVAAETARIADDPREPCRARRGRRRSGDLAAARRNIPPKEFLLRGTLLTGSEAAEIGFGQPRGAGRAGAPVRAGDRAELASGPTWAIRWTKASRVICSSKEPAQRVLPASAALRWFRPARRPPRGGASLREKNASRISPDSRDADHVGTTMTTTSLSTRSAASCVTRCTGCSGSIGLPRTNERNSGDTGRCGRSGSRWGNWGHRTGSR